MFTVSSKAYFPRIFVYDFSIQSEGIVCCLIRVQRNIVQNGQIGLA